MKLELMHPADQLVTIMERIYSCGMTTTSGGNLSILDDNGDIWITPAGVDKGSLTRNDMVRVSANGKITGNHRPSSEWPFHSIVYKRRPDIKAVLHAHPPALLSFSIVRKIPHTRLIPNADIICGDIKMAEYELPGSAELGENIAKMFDTGSNVVMLENHGVVVGDKDIFSAFHAFETLDFCARLEINALRLGNIKPLTEKYVEISRNKNNALLEEFEAKSYSSEEREARMKMCELVKRSYNQRLFTSTQGTFSERLSDGAFIITPYGMDRKYITPDDIVRIEDGKKERGKNPSRSVILHREIYARHPEVNSIIIAHPPNIMAFAVSDTDFDSKIIPESYIMLRDIPKVPFGSSFLQPALFAKEISPQTPVVLVENDCVIVAGESLINAFDRLEVAEFSANAIISARQVGEIVKISEYETERIKTAFNLK
ncbi:MAG: L-fuculose phosphate aldolase [Firmicutes bacterium ADurb.Bin193]|nr:MAG: L-fuculose phosphate aldolase [Firmicutes bacterium ADurb.Bin193]